MTNAAPQAEVRYELTLTEFDSPDSLRRAAEIIYRTTEAGLLAAMSGTPYLVGRSFSRIEIEPILSKLKELRVGYQVKSTKGRTVEFEFDPNKPDPESPIPVAEPVRKRTQKKTFWIALVSSIFMVSAGIWFFLPSIFLTFQSRSADSQSNTPAVALESTAKFVGIRNRVEHKSDNQLSWKTSRISDQLQLGDQVRTFTDAYATVLYREGSTVSVRPQSLIVIGPESANQKELSLENGTIRAQLREGVMNVVTKSGRLRITSPPKESRSIETRVTATALGGRLNVDVSEGVVEFQPPTSTTPLPIQSNQSLFVEGPKVSELQVFVPITLQLLRPNENQTLMIDPEAQNQIVFEWNPLPEITHYTWTIATDSKMRDVLFSQRSTEPRVELSYLDLGELFWRVTAESVNREEIPSEVRKLNVQKHRH